MPAIEQGTLDIATLIAGAAALVFIAGVLIEGVKRLLRRANRRTDEARQVFRDALPDQAASFPLPPSLEYLPRIYSDQPNIIPFSDMPGSVAISIEPVEPHLFNRFRRTRNLVAKLSLQRRSTTIALVIRKQPKNGECYENGRPQHGCDLVVGIDKQTWKRPHPQADTAGEVARVLRQTHWVHAGDPCRIEWRRYEGDFIQYDHGEALHPSALSKEYGWVLTRNIYPTTVLYPMTMPYNQTQIASADALWAGEVVYPYYLVLETSDGNGNALFQGMERRVTFNNYHVTERWGERFIQWEGPRHRTFSEAVRDLFKYHTNLKCSPIYTQGEWPAFNPLRDEEVEEGSHRYLLQHLGRTGPIGPNTINDRTACDLPMVGLFSCDTPEQMVKYAEGYQQKESTDTLSRHDRMPCRTCHSKAQGLAQA